MEMTPEHDGGQPTAATALALVSTRQDRWLSAAFLALAAVALGHALQIANGQLNPDAIWWLSVAVALTGATLVVPSERRVERVLALVLAFGMVLGLGFQISELLVAPPAMYVRYAPGWHLGFFRSLAYAAVLCGALLVPRPRLRAAAVLGLMGVHLWIGLWMLQASPAPFIDVFVFQRDAAAELLRGADPYAMTFPDIYGHTVFYGPGMVLNGRLQFGFPYPPLSLLLSTLGRALGGDPRSAQLAAMAAAGGLMAFMRPGRLGALAAALFLFTPREFFVLEQAWTEPFAVALLALTVFLAVRRPALVPYAFGLLVAVKQYMVLAIPLVPLLLPGPWTLRSAWRFLWRAGAVAAAVTAPLALIHPSAFWHSVVALQFFQPFRTDALSYLAWAAAGGEAPAGTAWASWVGAIGAAALALWRAPRTPAGFALGVTAVFLAFFALNKQAFCNYYFFVLGAMCTGVAALDPPEA